MERSMRKIEVLEDLDKSGMSLHEGAKTKVRMVSELLKELKVKVWMHQGSVDLSPLFLQWW